MGLKGNRLWLIAGTGEGPLLARKLLELRWRVKVSVVTPTARQTYPEDPNLEMAVGALADAEALKAVLEGAEREGDPFRWLIDASHPFAIRITPMAIEATRARPEGLLRLNRPFLEGPWATPLASIHDLPLHVRGSKRILLAIGARQLATASRLTQGACLHARVLPYPLALRQAQQAGIASSRIACFHPTADGAVELALCRHWDIDTIVCRQSGGRTEALWHGASKTLGLRLLLLQRPPEPEGIHRLDFEALIKHVGPAAGIG